MAGSHTVESVPADAVSLASGRYAIVSRIDAGGMSAVYRVWDRKLKVLRAMKVLLPEYARNARIRQRFESEARTMARLEHPNLVRIYDVGIEEELPYLVMELVIGGSLQKWIDLHGPMHPRLAVEAILQLVSGLGLVHQAGVVHRDIKPHNVLVAEPGICKLTDFGIAQLGEGGSTKTGTTLGTQGYMAPEQRADAKSVDARADLYGVGATLWALLTGKPAHDVFLAVERNPGAAPEYLHDILRRTCAYAREDRFATVGDLEEALRVALRAAPAGPATSELPVDETEDAPTNVSDDEIIEVLRSAVRGVSEPASTPPAAQTPSPGPTALPYYMPRPEKRRTLSQPSDAAEPDWIARDDPPRRDPFGDQVIGADPSMPTMPPTRMTPPATPPSAQRTQPAAKEREAKEREAKEPEPKPTPPPKTPTPTPPPPVEIDADSDSGGWAVYLLVPIAGLLLAALVSMLGVGAWITAASSGMRTAEQAVAERRSEVYDVLKDEGGAVQSLERAGLDTTELQLAFLAFRDARGEPGRDDAARDYVALLDITAADALSDSANPGQVEASHAYRRIRVKVQSWHDAEAAWVARSRTAGGRAATTLGLAHTPTAP